MQSYCDEITNTLNEQFDLILKKGDLPQYVRLEVQLLQNKMAGVKSSLGMYKKNKLKKITTKLREAIEYYAASNQRCCKLIKMICVELREQEVLISKMMEFADDEVSRLTPSPKVSPPRRTFSPPIVSPKVTWDELFPEVSGTTFFDEADQYDLLFN